MCGLLYLSIIYRWLSLEWKSAHSHYRRALNQISKYKGNCEFHGCLRLSFRRSRLLKFIFCISIDFWSGEQSKFCNKLYLIKICHFHITNRTSSLKLLGLISSLKFMHQGFWVDFSCNKNSHWYDFPPYLWLGCEGRSCQQRSSSQVPWRKRSEERQGYSRSDWNGQKQR